MAEWGNNNYPLITMSQLVLASSSTYRRQLLERLQVPFIYVYPAIDESPLPSEPPEHTALRLAQLKARKVALTHPNALIIGCDQVATLYGQQIGKPGNHENAVNQLKLMQGTEVTFHSALCLYNAEKNRMQAEVIPYIVGFRNLDEAQIESYLNKEKPYDCAGSAKSEGLGIALIAYMHGDDPNALIGLPLIRLVSMLQNEGIKVI